MNNFTAAFVPMNLFTWGTKRCVDLIYFTDFCVLTNHHSSLEVFRGNPFIPKGKKKAEHVTS